MHIHKIEIQNFRLLANVALILEEKTTVVVGRNNSGKTSLTEMFRRILGDGALSFKLEDFSLASHDRFWQAFLLHRKDEDTQEIREMLPVIEMRLTIAYGKDFANFGLISELVIDLNPECTEAVVVIRYQLKDGDIEAFFQSLAVDETATQEAQKTAFCRAIRDRVPPHYTPVVFAVDPNDPTNQKPLELSTLRAIVQRGFINAQRGLDDTTHKDINLLGKVLETLLSNAMADSADDKDRDVATKLEAAVENIQLGIDSGFNKQLQDLLPAFALFGYPGLSDPRLLTETTLDVAKLLKDHTKVHYAGLNGINLPEAYNGLGVRNLVFILLKLYEFFKDFKSREGEPGIHLVFVEEPEVHLHPQMQEVFIGKLNDIAKVFAKRFNDGKPWPVQFVVTTHSAHVANKAPFDAMRYFCVGAQEAGGTIRSTEIKDLRDGLGGTPKEDREFLHKYMTLTRCDLLFADKAILIEGTTERLLMPKMIEKLDLKTASEQRLSSEYLSVVEVGGAYAHLFFNLLTFLNLRTLVITDLDSVDNGGSSCKVSSGIRTSNACIKNWFNDPNVAVRDLIEKSDGDKTRNIIRLAYEVPGKPGASCGRSFEAAFILDNPALFELDGLSEADRETKAWDLATGVKKSDFALEYAITKTDWNIPRYIVDGLRWLAAGGENCSETPATSASPRVVAPKTVRSKKKSHA